MITLTTEQEAAIEVAFKEAAEIKQAMADVGRKSASVRHSISKAGKGGYSHLRLARIAMGQDVEGDTPAPGDAGELPRLRATLQGLTEMLIGLEDDYKEARYRYREAVVNAMRDHFEQVLDSYDLRAKALIEAWREVGNVAQWFRETGADANLPTNFFSAIHIENSVNGTPPLLKGRGMIGFKFSQELLTEGGKDMLSDKYTATHAAPTAALISNHTEEAKAG